MALQNRQGDFKVVRITVVKGDAQRTFGEAVIFESAHGLVQGQHVEPGLDPATQRIKTCSIHFLWK